MCVVEDLSKQTDNGGNTGSWNPSKKEIVSISIGTALFLAQMFVTFFLYYNQYSNLICLIIGWILLVIGAILMFRPMMALSKHGGVSDGDTWMKTTQIVDRDIFGIVRHPIYTGWLVYIISLDFLSQYWLTIALSIIPGILAFHFVNSEDASNLEKFGDDYRSYQDRVPKMNIILGIVGWWRRRAIEASS